MKELSKILNKYHTDKNTSLVGSHYYSELYDNFFKRYKNRKVKILEIGIQRGEDLLGFDEYFKGNCEIYGIDIDLSHSIINENKKNIHLYEFDGTDLILLHNWYYCENVNYWPNVNFEKFDIIIDDGSHASKDILKTLSFFYNKLTDDGIYIIEDLHSNYSEIDYTKSAIYFLTFFNEHEDINLSNVKNHIKTCNIYQYMHDNHWNFSPNKDINNISTCAILTFK